MPPIWAVDLAEIPAAVAKRIAKAVESSRSEGTRRTYAAGWRRFEGVRSGGACRVARAPGDRCRLPRGRHRHPHQDRGAGLRRRYVRDLDRGDQPPAPDQWLSVSGCTRTGDCDAVGDPPQVCRRRGSTPHPTRTVAGRRHQTPSRNGPGSVRGLGRRGPGAPRLGILLLGFAGAYRRSELSQMACGDITLHRLDGMHVRLRKSKTDQEGRGAVKALKYTESHEICPPCAYVRWAQVVALAIAPSNP